MQMLFQDTRDAIHAALLKTSSKNFESNIQVRWSTHDQEIALCCILLFPPLLPENWGLGRAHAAHRAP